MTAFKAASLYYCLLKKKILGMASFFLNIDSPEWDPVMPVMLPLGALNAIPFIDASYGVLMPSIVFIFATFHHLNGKLVEEAETVGDYV
jgi:hypothetical protein